jgi:hypothetical protein
MAKITISTVLVALCASMAWGATGDLTFMKKPPTTRSTSRLYVSAFKHAGADKAKGLVNEHSVVGEMRGAASGVSVAVDSSKPDATQPDVIRLDFSGKGTFKGAPTATIKMRPPQPNLTVGTIARTLITVKSNGRSVPVIIQGTYYKQKERRGLSLTMTAAVEGSCKFGGKTYPVRIIDGNGNFQFADALKPPYRPSTMMAFDKIMVGTDGGKFSSRAATSYVGQPIFIDGKLYSVDVSGMKIKSAPMKIAGGSVKVDAARWNCTLIGKKYYLSLNGGAEPVSVPADEYVTANYTVYTGSDPTKRCASIRGYGSYRGGKAFTVASGKTVDMQLGAPIEATVTAAKRSGKVSINLMMKDPLGGRISGISTEEGKRPPAPSIEVVDKAGKIIYTANLAYG